MTALPAHDTARAGDPNLGAPIASELRADAPTVIGPDQTPAIVDPEVAGRLPELAALSALAHGHHRDPELAARVAATAGAAVLDLPGERGVLYYDLIEACLSQAARRVFDMLLPGYQYQNEGLRKARAEGEAEGKAEGRAEGKAEGKAEAILAVLKERGLRVGPAQRERILGCTELSRLDRWLRAAITCSRTADIF